METDPAPPTDSSHFLVELSLECDIAMKWTSGWSTAAARIPVNVFSATAMVRETIQNNTNWANYMGIHNVFNGESVALVLLLETRFWNAVPEE